MSKEMQILFKQMQLVKPATEEPPKTSSDLMSLWSQIETRHWKEESLLDLYFFIEELDSELGFIEHIKNCGECLVELQLSVERYMGNNGPWWIYLRDSDYLPEYYPDCPKIDDYEIGSYWDGSSDDTVRFIKDRATWAKRITEKEFEASCKLIAIIENWPLSRGVPEETLRMMVDEIAGLPTIFLEG